LSLLVLPLYIPTLIFGAQTVVLAAQGLGNTTPFTILGAITLLSAAMIPFVAARALAVNIKCHPCAALPRLPARHNRL